MASDLWGNAETQRQIAIELQRIGATDLLQRGFATDVPITPDQLLRAFRATPTAGGSEAFYAALRYVLDTK